MSNSKKPTNNQSAEILNKVDAQIKQLESKRLKELEDLSIGYRAGDLLLFGNEHSLAVRSMTGFGLPEGSHVWSLDHQSSIEIVLQEPLSEPHLFQSRFTPFICLQQQSQTILLSVNGRLIAQWEAFKTKDYYAIIPPQPNPKNRFLTLEFTTPNSMKPSNVTNSEDGRQLGFALENLCFKPLSQAV